MAVLLILLGGLAAKVDKEPCLSLADSVGGPERLRNGTDRRRPALVIRPRRWVSPELSSRGTSPR